MTTTEKQAPPESCPICGMAEDWRDTDVLGNVSRVAYMCGAKWAQYNAHRVPLSPPEWVSDCSHAMDACLRTGATLHPTALEQARDALVGGAINGLTGHDITSLDIHNLRGLAYAYLAALEQRS